MENKFIVRRGSYVRGTEEIHGIGLVQVDEAVATRQEVQKLREEVGELKGLMSRAVVRSGPSCDDLKSKELHVEMLTK